MPPGIFFGEYQQSRGPRESRQGCREESETSTMNGGIQHVLVQAEVPGDSGYGHAYYSSRLPVDAT